MNTMTSYFTLKESAEGLYKDKGSKFIAYSFPVKDVEEIKEIIALLRIDHPKARHVCYAYRLGNTPEEARSNDDGEPSGSAGKPILNTIISNNLHYTLVAVVRYFGGKLLGVPGLIHAYGSAANEALTAANWVQKDIFYRIFVAADFQIQHEIIRLCKQNSVKFYPDMQNQNQGITFEVAPAKKDVLMAGLSSRNFTQITELGIIYE
jgi:uncharacterized YigZ family protein